jgi:hypothetical protein
MNSNATRLIPKSTPHHYSKQPLRPFSTPARQVVPSAKKTNQLAAAKPWSELSTPQKGTQ